MTKQELGIIRKIKALAAHTEDRGCRRPEAMTAATMVIKMFNKSNKVVKVETHDECQEAKKYVRAVAVEMIEEILKDAQLKKDELFERLIDDEWIDEEIAKDAYDTYITDINRELTPEEIDEILFAAFADVDENQRFTEDEDDDEEFDLGDIFDDIDPDM